MRSWKGFFRWRGRGGRLFVGLVAGVYVSLVLFSLLNFKTRVRYDSTPEMFGDPVFTSNADTDRCRLNLPTLGLVKVNVFANPSLESVEKANPEVALGGRWAPSNCSAWQRVAIIVPYRDRLHHLRLLLARLHPMLRKQMVDYQIFVVEQAGQGQFNRGSLRNVGVLEALKVSAFDCFVFHDVDMLPEHDQNIYYCDRHAHHLSSALDEMRYHVMYYSSAGGVIAVNKENIFKMNGYSNAYWGWGNEDDDFSARAEAVGLLLTRPPEYIGRYKMVRHVKQWRSDTGNNLFLSWRSRWRSDGLNSLDPAQFGLSTRLLPLYTHITVNLGPAPPLTPPSPDAEAPPQQSWVWFLSFYFP